MKYLATGAVLAYVALALVVLLLAACAPTLTATLIRSGEAVTITITVTEPVDLAGVTIIGDDLETTDERCSMVEDALSCDLGNLQPGSSTIIALRGVDVSCIASGYAGSGVADFRVFRCRAANSE